MADRQIQHADAVRPLKKRQWRRLLEKHVECIHWDQPNPPVRGWHSDCSAATFGFGTYDLKLASDGTIYCHACGAQDLVRPARNDGEA